jgi:hypothetical protein
MKFYKIEGYCTTYVSIDDTRQATVEDAINADWSLDDIYGSSLDEYLDENGELLESEFDEDLGDYIIVSYWDGNNFQYDLYDRCELEIVEGEVISLSHPSPAYYFNYEIVLEDGEKIKVTQSNMSGSLSPYYREDTEE